jgi:hypothetical protein
MGSPPCRLVGVIAAHGDEIEEALWISCDELSPNALTLS